MNGSLEVVAKKCTSVYENVFHFCIIQDSTLC
jgi:hypothetical protein